MGLAIAAAQSKTARIPVRLLAANCVATAIPLYVIARFLYAALYAFPESDDYCWFYHYRDDGLIGTVQLFYSAAIGRVVPTVLIAVPGIVTGGSVSKLVGAYPWVLIGFALLFFSASLYVVLRLWREISKGHLLFLSLGLVAVIWSNSNSVRELLYWLPGAACYAVPAAMVAVILVELYVSALDDRALSRTKTAALVGLCFFSALCNEFTPIWLIGMIGGSFLFRSVSRHSAPQLGAHTALLLATMIGFAILLAAPGNSVRMGQFPGSGRFLHALAMAVDDSMTDLKKIFLSIGLLAWFAAVALYSGLYRPHRRKFNFALSASMIVLLLGCTYVANFVGLFATGTSLVPRAGNQVLALLVVGFTCVLVGLGPTLSKLVAPDVQLTAVGAAILAALLMLPTLTGRSFRSLQSEWRQFDTFRSESMHRNDLLLTAQHSEMIVPARTARPRPLVEQDLTSNPDRLPNDCIAAAYSLKSVVAE